MNTAPLKSYAPAARQAFIAAVTSQAARLGITAKEAAPATVQGDVLLVNGQAFPRSAESGRNKLITRVKTQGFEATMDAVAYTWFNRLVAIRYMELHNYLDHGYRVLSDPSGSGRPEILDRAADVELPGLDRSKAIKLKLDGTKDEELYRMLLMAQCNALHKAMPFLFEKIGDETELLLPANLLHTDSLIRRLVKDIEESAWDPIEIIGWLYQFYISEKKDQVIGKVVKSEDIPAATQLFTPNWIVKYLVQNSLGAQWLATYPTSPLKSQMEYYIEPAKQTDEVNAQLAAITPAALNPEEITLIDPACGSGHILVEAYDLFKAIYLERGYRERDAAQLILTKNLYGLDIDQRAAQLSGFALMMKGRADDRRLFERGVKLNVMSMVNSDDLNIADLTHEVKLADFGLEASDLRELKKLFEHATTFGSLIQMPECLVTKLPALRELSKATVGEVQREAGDMFAAEALACLGPLVRQAEVLTNRYDNVVANPPYMGDSYQPPTLKNFLLTNSPGYEKDLFSAFIIRNLRYCKSHGRLGFMTPYVWMFIPNHIELRRHLVEAQTLASLVQLEYSGFDGATVPICTFILRKHKSTDFCASYIRLADFKGAENQAPKVREAIDNPKCGWLFTTAQFLFKKIEGWPIAYRVTPTMASLFERGKMLGELVEAAVGVQTGRNETFLRRWYEVDFSRVGLGLQDSRAALNANKKWIPYNKGGKYRKWYGNCSYVLNWEQDGRDLRAFKPRAVLRNPHTYFRESLSWSDVTSGPPSFRLFDCGFIHDVTGMSAFDFHKVDRYFLAGYCNTPICVSLSSAINETFHFQVGDFIRIPILLDSWSGDQESVKSRVEELVSTSRIDWNSFEYAWDFERSPLLEIPSSSLEESYLRYAEQGDAMVDRTKELEEANNRYFLEAYSLANEFESTVPRSRVSLNRNAAFRFQDTEKRKLTESYLRERFCEETLQELVSYAVGCMMGRYSLDEPGLVFAHSGNIDFDLNRYAKFPADDDGIIPVTDSAWYQDDAANRLVDFISVAWDAAHLEENLTFLADNLSPSKNETSRDTLRRYLCDKFFKDHLQTYKKRPIYWFFSSGKQKAFQCLVYLHRYNEGTLARMRSEYVIPLQGKMASRLAHLEEDLRVASTAQQKRIEKESAKLRKQQTELLAFDEKLRHYADRRITLDLDDGVKVNYGKFGSLLAEVAAVHGQKAEGP
jgi:hypothetical protein